MMTYEEVKKDANKINHRQMLAKLKFTQETVQRKKATKILPIGFFIGYKAFHFLYTMSCIK